MGESGLPQLAKRAEQNSRVPTEEHAGCVTRQAFSAEAVKRDHQGWWPASLHEPLAG